MKPSAQRRYVPALGYSWLSRGYDPLLRWTLRERTWRKQLVEDAGLQPGQRVLDIGCGTGSLAFLIREGHPGVTVAGLDGDAAILSIARQKAPPDEDGPIFHQGLSTALPYPEHSFDRVFSSLLLHHLTSDDKARTLREAWRVLRPGGRLHLADWGPSSNLMQRGAFYLVQILDGFETTRDNIEGRLVELAHAAGFADMTETAHFNTVFGTLRLYAGHKALPSDAAPAVFPRPLGKSRP